MELTGQSCIRSAVATDATRAKSLLAQIHTDWSLSINGEGIYRTYLFSNYYETIAFINALAWITHSQDHHPDLQVSYAQCTVNYTTHSVSGLSENDFICADLIDQLMQKPG